MDLKVLAITSHVISTTANTVLDRDLTTAPLVMDLQLHHQQACSGTPVAGVELGSTPPARLVLIGGMGSDLVTTTGQVGIAHHNLRNHHQVVTSQTVLLARGITHQVRVMTTTSTILRVAQARVEALELSMAQAVTELPNQRHLVFTTQLVTQDLATTHQAPIQVATWQCLEHM